MKQKENKLLAKPEVQKELAAAVELGKREASRVPSHILHLRELLSQDAIAAVFDSILETSPINQIQKDYIKAVFIKQKDPKKAMKKLVGRDAGAGEQALYKAMMNHPAIKEFEEVVRIFYMRAVPVAQMKELEMIFNPLVKDKVKLDAIKDIQDRAGMGAQVKQPGLPVNVIVNIPTQHNITVNKEGA